MWPRGRRLAVAGFALYVASATLYFILQVRSGYFHSGAPVRYDVEAVLSLMASGATFVAWWWLSALAPDAALRRVVRVGYYAIAVQSLLNAAMVLLGLSTSTRLDALYNWSASFEAVGALAVALGLTLLARDVGPRTTAGLEEEWPEEDDERGLDGEPMP